MRHNAVVQDSAGESFAGLLEHLTRHSEPEASESGFAPRNSSPAVLNSILGSNSRSAARSLLPVAEVKTGHGAAMPESTPLSYEKALRLHARRQRGPNANLDLPAGSAPSVPSQAGAVSSPQSQTTARKPSKPGESSARMKGFANSASRKQKILKTPAETASGSSQPATQAGVQPGAKLATRSSSQSQSKSQSKAPSKTPPSKPSPKGQHPADAQSSSYAASPSFTPRKRSSTAISGPRHKPKLSSSSKPALNTPRPDITGVLANPSPWNAASGKAIREDILPSAEDRSLTTVERHDLEWTPAGPLQSIGTLGQMAQTAQIDLRQAIVSLRLTDVELLRLKDRASESGISVSAYMRSCILDADQLRAQVKQALAEMRALSAMPVPSRFPALAAPKSNDSDASTDWLRVLMRSAACLLSPLFPFRRSA
jgi:hypothetical protein